MAIEIFCNDESIYIESKFNFLLVFGKWVVAGLITLSEPRLNLAFFIRVRLFNLLSVVNRHNIIVNYIKTLIVGHIKLDYSCTG